MQHTRVREPREPEPKPTWVGWLVAGDRGVALALAVASVVAGMHAVVQLGVVSRGQPGPGLFPFVLSVALMALSAWVARAPAAAALPGRMPWRQRVKVLEGMGVYAAYPVLLPVLGYVVCSAAFVVAWLLAVERQPVGRALAGGALTAVAVWLIFGVGLNVPLPQGWLIVR